jgi:hypothetical protein
VKKSNLKPWQPGTSGNPNGRPKGSRSVKTVIVDMLNDPNTYKLLPNTHPRGTQTPLEAIVCTLMIKSINGDVRASDVLLKYAVDRDMTVDEGGFFSQSELKITVVDSKGQPYHDVELPLIDSQLLDSQEPSESTPTVS